MKRKILNGIKILAVLSLSAFFLSACASENKKESLSMEKIQKKEGYPVTIEKVEPQTFKKYLTFVGKFKGIRQTIVGAMIGGRIQKINAKPGDRVKKNQVIIEFPEDSPASQIQQARAAFDVAQKTYNRMKALFKAGQVSQAQLDGTEAKYLVTKRNYETMKQMLKLDVPYDGTITEVMVHEGDNVKAKTPLFTVAKLNKMKIRIWLSDEERMEIKKGMTAYATVGDKTFVGKVADLSIAVDPMKQAFYADVIFNNAYRQILPGLTANVKVVVYENDNAIVVPRNLIFRDNSGQYVFVAKGSEAVKRYVTVKNQSGINSEIALGLNAGDLLITKGVARLTDGVKIKAVN